MTQASKASVDEILHVPAALALHQRPGVPGIRSTFGTGTELLNSLRLMYSRLASHCCPNGHYLAPTLAVAAGKDWSALNAASTFLLLLQRNWHLTAREPAAPAMERERFAP
jgi:excinuclease UvrABC ATPase subunit